MRRFDWFDWATLVFVPLNVYFAAQGHALNAAVASFMLVTWLVIRD